MLSKVAERIYWTARYMERVESTARMISIYDQLLFDLPRNVSLSWYNLIIINGIESLFASQYSVRDERNVVKFLLADDNNPSSIMSCLRAVRENVRTTRDVVLEETWERVNELSLFMQDNLQQGLNRSKRRDFLQHVIKSCQHILGLLYGNMPHDAAWDFLRLGRNLERADMTTRTLDAGVAAILEVEDDSNAVNSHQIIWGTVLRSLNADLSYRRKMRTSVKGEIVVQYLLEDEQFPRSIAHCFNALADSSSKLPHSKNIVAHLSDLQKNLFIDINYEKLDESFRDYLNDLQITLGKLHFEIGATWFQNHAEIVAESA